MKKMIANTLIFINLILVSFSPVKAANASDTDCDLFKSASQSVQVLSNSNNKIYISKDDIYLMAQVVYGESRSEPYAGKVAVASVIINRLKDSHFPKSVEGVIKQKKAFSCVVNGNISFKPDKESFNAVLDALKGNDPTNNAIFFYNPKIATCNWMRSIPKSNKKIIGNHVFFVVE